MKVRTPITVTISGLTGAGYTADKLLRETGPLKTITVMSKIIADTITGKPWDELPPPTGKAEELSRGQLQGAVLLERNLRNVVGNERAREITRDIVLKSSIDFLSMTVPILRKSRFLSKDEAARLKYLERIQSNFFNAEADMQAIGNEELRMTVQRCIFVELLDAIGERDMAELFCAGDMYYFNERQPEVRLERSETLASGGSCCDFRFFWEGE